MWSINSIGQNLHRFNDMNPVSPHFPIHRRSRRLAVVVLQQPTEPLRALDRGIFALRTSGRRTVDRRWRRGARFGLSLSSGEVSRLAWRFLDYLERLHDPRPAPSRPAGSGQFHAKAQRRKVKSRAGLQA